MQMDDAGAGGERGDGLNPHGAVEAEQIGSGGALGVAGGAPFQQFAPGEIESHERSNDRVEADVCIIREAGEEEAFLQHLSQDDAAGDAEASDPGQFAGAAGELFQTHHDGGNRDDAEHEERVENRIGRGVSDQEKKDA